MLTLKSINRCLVMLCTLSLVACSSSSLRTERISSEYATALAPATTGVLAEMAGDIADKNGQDTSGFKLLDESYDAMVWRLALIDSATTSLDIQTYLWYPDNAGRLILARAVLAADRGVKVRLIIDDLLTIGLDQVMYELENHENIEMKLFNPWEKRGLLSRSGEMIARMERLNTRMHDKLLIADGHAAIVGGRNIGDHYFGLSDAYNFHDLDLLGFGHIADQANEMFDSFWNSDWVESAKNIDKEHDAQLAQELRDKVGGKNADAKALSTFKIATQDWSKELAAVMGELHIGRSEMIFDNTTEDKINQNVAAEMFNIMNLAQEELLVTNAYIIPGQAGIDFIQKLTDRGVKVRILTNSLASHDVPAVNSHYEEWRDDIINAGAELYELRADGEMQSLIDIPPNKGRFIGLHTKALVIDRDKVFIGSMNFDPRSFQINTEAGALVESAGLGEALAQVMERDMSPENAWQVLLNDKGKPYWVNSDETLERQPARDSGQRIMNEIFKIFPKEQF